MLIPRQKPQRKENQNSGVFIIALSYKFAAFYVLP